MTEIFNRIDLTDSAPAGVCVRCAAQGLEHRPTGATFLFCRHTELGALRTPGNAWRTVTGFDAGRFKNFVLATVMEGEQRFIEAQTDGMSSH